MSSSQGPDEKSVEDRVLSATRLVRSRRYDEALATCDEIIELDSDIPEAYRIRAEANRKLGRATEAEADLDALDALFEKRGRAIEVPWYEDLDTTWRQLAGELRAEFKPIEQPVRTTVNPWLGATIVKKSARWEVNLEYRAMRLYRPRGRETTPYAYMTTTTMKGRLNGYRSKKIYDNYSAKSLRDAGEVSRLLDDESGTFQRLMPEALDGSSVDISTVSLSFEERSGDISSGRLLTPTGPAWPMPENDLPKLRALFALFDAALERLAIQDRQRRQQARHDYQLMQERHCAALQELGVKSRMLGRSDLPQEPDWVGKGYLKIDNSPIRWAVGDKFFIPDPRIHPHYGWRKHRWVWSTRARSRPFFGPAKEISWESMSYVGSDYVDTLQAKGAENILIAAQNLSVDPTLGGKLNLAGLDLLVQADPRRRCWVVSSRNPRDISRAAWDCYVTASETLLAMPLRSDR